MNQPFYNVGIINSFLQFLLEICMRNVENFHYRYVTFLSNLNLKKSFDRGELKNFCSARYKYMKILLSTIIECLTKVTRGLPLISNTVLLNISLQIERHL